MDSIQNLFIKWTQILFFVLADAAVLAFFSQEQGLVFLSFLPWLLALTLALLVNAFVLSRGTTILLYCSLVFLESVGAGFATLHSLSWREPSLLWTIVHLAAVIASGLFCGVLSYEGVNRRREVIDFDFSVFLSGILVLVHHFFPESMAVESLFRLSLFTLFVLASGLVSLRLEGSTGDLGRKRKSLMLVVLVLTLAFLFSYLLQRGVTEFSEVVINTFVYLISHLYALIAFLVTAFFRWFFSLFPDPEGGMGYEMEDYSRFLERAEEETREEGNPLVIAVLLGLMVLALVVAVLLKLWGVRIGGRRKQGRTVRKVRRKSRLLYGGRKFFSSLFAFLRFWTRYLLSPSSPATLFLWTEHYYLRRGRLRRKGETPRAYLERMADDSTREVFSLLAALLDQTFYGETKAVMPEGFPKKYREAVKKRENVDASGKK